jgi:hemerythrin superfamily protein
MVLWEPAPTVNATELLKAQHRKIESLLDELEEAEGAAVLERFEELFSTVVAHDVIELELFYPECQRASVEPALLGEAVVEHGVIAFSLHVTDEAREKNDFDYKLVVLAELLEHHLEEEEAELLPRAEEAIDAEALEALGEKMEDRFLAIKASDCRAVLRDRLKGVIGTTLVARAKRAGNKKPNFARYTRRAQRNAW